MKIYDDLSSDLSRNVKYKLRHPDKVKESSKRYSETHKEQIKEKNKLYKESHKDLFSERNKKYYQTHKEKLKEYHKKYNQENKKKLREKARNREIPRKYGISVNEYVELLEKQGSRCIICGEPNINNINLCIDHDHKTGKVRGLLCHPCNDAIGLFKENIELMNNAINYLMGNR